MGLHYAQSVDYFGMTWSNGEIVADMYNSVKRWPVRRYTVYNNQIDAKCASPGAANAHASPVSMDYAACDVHVMIEWHVDNQKGRKVGGLTQGFYTVIVGATAETQAGRNNYANVIYAQSENVINRHPE
jgi:hypothetical protein